jgi:hypothetical protein
MMQSASYLYRSGIWAKAAKSLANGRLTDDTPPADTHALTVKATYLRAP